MKTISVGTNSNKEDFIASLSDSDFVTSLIDTIVEDMRKRETPSCHTCGSALKISQNNLTSKTPDGLLVAITFQFGCSTCNEFGYGDTLWDSIVNYVKNYIK